MLNQTPLSLPPQIDDEGLLVGWSLEHEHARVPPGFSFGGSAHTPADGFLDPYLFDDEGHLITVAPTGTGKGVSCVIPSLLRYAGDVVVMDPKGENYAVTRRARAARGQVVHRIDPWGVMDHLLSEEAGNDKEAASLNPLDLLPYLSDDRAAACRSLARLLYGEPAHDDSFWDHTATAVLAGLVDAYDRASGDWRSVVQIAHDLTVAPARGGVSPIDDVPAVRSMMAAWGYDVTNVQSHALADALGAGRSAVNDMRSGASVCQEDDAPSTREDKIRAVMEDVLIQVTSLTGLTGRPCMRLSHIAIDRARGRWTADGSRQVVHDNDLQFGDGPETGANDTPFPLAIQRLLVAEGPAAVAAASIVRGAPDKTWGSILVSLQGALSTIAGSGLRAALGSAPPLDLERLRQGTGTSLFLVIPPAKLVSHAPMVRTLVAGILTVLASRTATPLRRTLLLLDEMGQIGRMNEFLTAVTLLRGYGVQVWSFWQDLSQLRAAYPAEWQTVVNNCAVFQAFGCATPLMAGELAEIHDVHRGIIFDLDDDEMILSVRGDSPVIAQRPFYYSDPCFSGSWAPNPLRRAPAQLGRQDKLLGTDAVTAQIVRRRSKLRLASLSVPSRGPQKAEDE